jgi:hypothetical protein
MSADDRPRRNVVVLALALVVGLVVGGGVGLATKSNATSKPPATTATGSAVSNAHIASLGTLPGIPALKPPPNTVSNTVQNTGSTTRPNTPVTTTNISPPVTTTNISPPVTTTNTPLTVTTTVNPPPQRTTSATNTTPILCVNNSCSK